MRPALSRHSTLRDAVREIEASRRSIAVVVDDGSKLIGTVTDGDIRRAILAGQELDDTVGRAMNRTPLTADNGTSDSYLVALLKERGLEAIPLVDAEGRLVRLVHIADLDPESARGGGEGYAAVVIMAGGEGQRLRPLTEEKPKPMIEVGGRPMIERLVCSLVRAGVPRIYIAINYLGHIIEDYFGDGSEFGTDIAYLREEEKMGTAGALSLLPELPPAPLLVINGDVLTGSDYRNLLLYHDEHDAVLTVAATDYRVEIPYGVLRTEGTRVTGIVEKPSQRFLCIAGIYVLAPEVLAQLPEKRPCDMPDLIEAVLLQGGNLSVFPIHEYWTDISNVADLARAENAVKDLG